MKLLYKSKNKEIEKNSCKIHSFAVCAYKESPYLEECIKSIMNQSVRSNCIIATSTPNKYIENIAKKYNIKYYIRDEKTNIQDDWNFAASCVNTELVTIAHQDDIYSEKYLEEILRNYDKNGLMYCMDYYTLKNGKVGNDINSRIRAFLKIFLRSKILGKIKFFKVMSLSFGNSINCPSVVYNKKLLGEKIFKSNLNFALDWDTFLRIAKMKGRIVYIPKKLIYYRIHKQATTKEFIENNKRKEEDMIMFNKIWPECITKVIMKFYIKSYDTYK